MNTMELIRTRRSVRTMDGRPLTAEDRDRLSARLETIRNPYDIPVEFVLLDAGEHGLSSPVIKGASLYIAAKVAAVPHGEEAFGFSFEEMVLAAWSMGIGTTWIAGSMNRRLFERAAGVRDGERMYCVSPLGYPAPKMSLRETVMRKGVGANHRKPWSELFFDGDFSTPLTAEDPAVSDALEAVRLAPSAVNQQPWRVVRQGARFHFYEKHSKGYAGKEGGDLQKVDLGIALCHFMRMLPGELCVEDPGLAAPEGMDYIATVAAE